MNPRSLLITLSILLLPFFSASAAVPESWQSGHGEYTAGDLVIHEGTTYIATQTVNSSLGNPTAVTASWSSLDALAGTKSTPTGQPDSTPDTSTLSTLSVPSDTNTTSGTGGTDTGAASGLSTATNEQFVKQQYLDFLGREPDADGLSYWLSEMASGTKTRADVVNFFVFSDEFQEKVAPVSRLYQAYFLRIPDTSGLNYWINLKLGGTSLADISTEFAKAEEFSRLYGTLDDTSFVNLVYTNVLGRPADASGLTYWVDDRLAVGDSRGTVMIGFSESKEYKDFTLNKIRVIAFYYGMLRRAPDQSGFDYWVAKLDAGEAPNDLINGFLASNEYQSRFSSN